MTEIYFPDWIPEKLKKPPVQNTSNFIEVHTDKNNITFRTTCTNACFGLVYPDSTDNLCGWCRHGFEGQPIGAPIFRIKDDYWMVDCFCSGECCLAYLQDHLEKKVEKQDPLLKNSLPLLFQLFERLAPERELVPANDWRLLEKVGTGNMRIEQFRSNFIQFNRTNNVKFKSSPVYYQAE